MREVGDILCSVKYCGGCQTSFDRKKLYERLVVDCPEITFRYYSDAMSNADALLIINGCRAVCVSAQALNFEGCCVIVGDESDYETAKKSLQEKARGKPVG